MTSHEDDSAVPFFERPGTVKKLFLSLGVACMALVAIDFLYHKHGHFHFEEWPLFFAGYGFLAFALVVAVGASLRFVISRSEEYYEPQHEPEAEEAEDHLRG